MTDVSAERPLVVVLDDVHVADASSWDVLRYLAANLRQAPVMVIATARPEELTAQPAANHVLLELGQEDLVRRLELGPLDDDRLRELTEEVCRRRQASLKRRRKISSDWHIRVRSRAGSTRSRSASSV